MERQSYVVAAIRSPYLRTGLVALIAFVVCGNVAAVWLLSRGIAAPGLLSFFALVVVVAALGTASCTVDVGADGVLLRSLRSATFIPIAQIEDAEMHKEPERGGVMYWVRLDVGDDKAFHIAVGPNDADKPMADALAERVRKVIAANRGAHAEDAPALLARGARPIGQWIDELRAMGSGAAATLRTEAVTSERLWRIVQSAGARPIDRAAAAVALSATTREDRLRLRVAANAVIDPKLRVVLESAAEQSATLEKALAKLEA